MVDPPPWPDRPEGAQDFDQFWLVRQLPPLPFPDESYDYGADPAFGPPGTRWVYPVADLAERETAPGVPDGVRAAARRLLDRLKLRAPPLGSASWATPEPLNGSTPPTEMRDSMAMLWARTVIVGVIGTDESVAHTLQWRHSTDENAPIGPVELKTIGDAVRDKWVAFLNGAMPSGAVVKSQLPTQLRYTEVRTSAIGQLEPEGPLTWGPQTVVSAFPANTAGTAVGQPLPYEVAMGISLNTNWRGTSRFRGRLYLGPISQDAMTQNGNFLATVVDGVGAVFGAQVLAGVEAATDYEAHVISQKYNTSAKITGVRMGEVPDSQRRRRRNRPESYAQVWGQPVGAL